MRTFTIFFSMLLMVLSLTGKTQEFAFEERTIELKAFDTSNYCCVKTTNAEIFFRKSDFISKLENDVLIKLIEEEPKPVICIGEQLDSTCKSEANTLINQSNLPHLNQKIAGLILTGNCMIRIKHQENFLTEIHAKTRFRRKAIGLREVLIYDSISQTLVHTSILLR